jgi:poly-gamma-glutamate synthesis protein (capsule biosynthesis protein)
VLAKPAKKPLAKKVKISFASPKVEHKIHLKKIDEHVKTLRAEILPIAAPVSHLNLNPHLKQRTFLFISVVVVSIFVAVSVFALWNSSKNPNLNQVSAVEDVPSIPAVTSDSEPVSLIATGDVMFARYVELKMRNNKDYTWPVIDTADFLKSADITFGNMESPLLTGRNTPTNSMTFRADLKSTEALKAAGYDVVSVANNHTMNYQIPGLTSTLQELKKAGIKYVGGGKDLETAYAPTILEVKGKKVAFFAYNDSSIPPKFHGEAGKNVAGIAPMDI